MPETISDAKDDLLLNAGSCQDSGKLQAACCRAAAETGPVCMRLHPVSLARTLPAPAVRAPWFFVEFPIAYQVGFTMAETMQSEWECYVCLQIFT